jgi:hypothetical protein
MKAAYERNEYGGVCESTVEIGHTIHALYKASEVVKVVLVVYV